MNLKNSPKKYRRRPRTSRPSLRFSPTGWAKLVYLRDRGETEIGGFGISAENDPLLVIDVLSVKQRCSVVTVAFDDAAVADLFDDLIDQGLQPERFSRIWIHSHPGNCPLPSSVDEATFRRVFGRTDWSVMAILAKNDAAYARLSFHVGPGGALEIPVRVDYGQPFAGANWEAWEEEYEENVVVQTFPTTVKASGIFADPFVQQNSQPTTDWEEFYDGTSGTRSV